MHDTNKFVLQSGDPKVVAETYLSFQTSQRQSRPTSTVTNRSLRTTTYSIILSAF